MDSKQAANARCLKNDVKAAAYRGTKSLDRDVILSAQQMEQGKRADIIEPRDRAARIVTLCKNSPDISVPVPTVLASGSPPRSAGFIKRDSKRKKKMPEKKILASDVPGHRGSVPDEDALKYIEPEKYASAANNRGPNNSTNNSNSQNSSNNNKRSSNNQSGSNHYATHQATVNNTANQNSGKSLAATNHSSQNHQQSVWHNTNGNTTAASHNTMNNKSNKNSTNNNKPFNNHSSNNTSSVSSNHNSNNSTSTSTSGPNAYANNQQKINSATSVNSSTTNNHSNNNSNNNGSNQNMKKKKKSANGTSSSPSSASPKSWAELVKKNQVENEITSAKSINMKIYPKDTIDAKSFNYDQALLYMYKCWENVKPTCTY